MELERSPLRSRAVLAGCKGKRICIAPRHERTSKALRYGTRSQGCDSFTCTPRVHPQYNVHQVLRAAIVTDGVDKTAQFEFEFNSVGNRQPA